MILDPEGKLRTLRRQKEERRRRKQVTNLKLDFYYQWLKVLHKGMVLLNHFLQKTRVLQNHVLQKWTQNHMLHKILLQNHVLQKPTMSNDHVLYNMYMLNNRVLQNRMTLPNHVLCKIHMHQNQTLQKEKNLRIKCFRRHTCYIIHCWCRRCCKYWRIIACKKWPCNAFS